MKLFVGSSSGTASCLLAGFPPHFLGSEGDLGVVLPGTTSVCLLFTGGGGIYTVSSSLQPLLLHVFLEALLLSDCIRVSC